MTQDINLAATDFVDPDDRDNNTSGNPHINDILALRMHRRYVLKGGVGAMTMAGLGTLGLTACGGGTDSTASVATPGPELKFSAVARATTDRVTVPAGYTATVIYATGDSLSNSVPDYKNDGTDGNFAQRSGDHHDGIHFFGLSATGAPSSTTNDRALLVMNHENIAGTVQFMHTAGQTNASSSSTSPRPESEATKEIEAHGVSIVEIAKTNGKFAYVKGSTFNRRITASTPMELTGPARGTDFVRTAFSPTGTQTRGTINNCGNGYTPWGTYLTAEENWAGYFRRDAADDANRSARELAQLARNGIRNLAGNNRWTSVVPAVAGSTEFSRWNLNVDTTKPANGSGDFRNAANTYGYIVEIDPYNPTSVPAKRTAMGRRANEGAWPSLAIVGRPLAFYIGCDSRGEYIYKFVSKKLWVAADANTADRMATGASYLDEGTIYAARFNADGTGTWVKCDLSNPLVAAGVPVSTLNPAGYQFESLADICVNTRLAAGAAGATRMDRPEWTAVNPKTGEIYITCTENPDRGGTGTTNNNIPMADVDAANPRYWADSKEISSQNAAKIPFQRGNVNGHIMRMRETGDNAAAETSAWDIFLFGAQAVADPGFDNVNWQENVNPSKLSKDNDLSKPDGCWFSRASGILWIETDDNTFTDQSNAMLLAAIPGTTGDGGQRTVVNLSGGSPVAAVNSAAATTKSVVTYAGKPMNDTIFKRFLTAPTGAEVTGVTESPDGTALFVNIQHPGENTTASQFTTGIFESNWPANGGGVSAYGAGGASGRPRSATIMITKNDGGIIGL